MSGLTYKWKYIYMCVWIVFCCWRSDSYYNCFWYWDCFCDCVCLWDTKLTFKWFEHIFRKKAVGGSNSDINNLDGLIGLRGGLWKREIENELDHRSLRIRIFQLRHLSWKCDCSVSGGEICYEECRPWKHVLHVVTNLGAMQVMLKLKDYNGSHVEG